MEIFFSEIIKIDRILLTLSTLRIPFRIFHFWCCFYYLFVTTLRFWAHKLVIHLLFSFHKNRNDHMKHDEFYFIDLDIWSFLLIQFLFIWMNNFITCFIDKRSIFHIDFTATAISKLLLWVYFIDKENQILLTKWSEKYDFSSFLLSCKVDDTDFK